MSGQLLPEDVYLDTSVVIAAVIPGILYWQSATELCDQLIAQRSTIYFSQVLRLELTEAVRKVATIPGRAPEALRQRFRLGDWERDHSVRRHWFNFGVGEFEALFERFAEVYELPFDRTIWLRSVEIMAAHQLRSHDSIHLATAYENRLTCLATTDDEFLKIPDLDIRLVRDRTP